MSECYPTGCTPCTEPISFPENPLNGDIYCVDAGNDTKKCWTYDNCIPGWRAQGPSASPSVYRGAINIKTQEPGENIEAGHFYIQTETVVSPYQPEWGIKVAQVSPVVANNRIAFNGQDWEVIPGPEVPYAEEARDINPSPDDRIGGITKNASLQDALKGTKKCDAITPYTLKNYVEEELNKLPNPTVGNGKLVLTQGSNKLGEFFANQSDNEEIIIPSPGNGKIVLQQNGKTQGEFLLNQSSNKVINLEDSFDNTSLPGEILGQVVGNRLITARNLSSFGRSHQGQYFYNTRLTGLSFDNLIYSVSCDAGIGDGGGRAGTICVNKIENGTQIRVQTANGYSNPGNISEQILIAWVKS